MKTKNKRGNNPRRKTWFNLTLMLTIIMGVVLILAVLHKLKAGVHDTSQISGMYLCSGTERGLLAGVGELMIAPDGNYEFSGFFAPSATGRLYWLNDTQLKTTEETDYAMITIHEDSQYSLYIRLREGVTYSHADTGFMDCIMQE